MSFKPTLNRLATHLPRQPSIKFPIRSLQHNQLVPTPHPHAPQSIIDAFPSFLQRLAKSKTTTFNPIKSNSTSTTSSTSSNNSIKADYEGEWDMPSYLSRGRYRPSAEEIEAVESGGASSAPTVTKSSRAAWYTPQRF